MKPDRSSRLFRGKVETFFVTSHQTEDAEFTYESDRA